MRSKNIDFLLYIIPFINFNKIIYRIDLFSKKLIFLNQKEHIANKYKINIFDLEDNRLFIRTCSLRIIQSLKGMSQNSCGNSLYLCGSNNQKSSCFLIHINLESTSIKTEVLVNAVYPHYKPIVYIVHSDIIVVIGGKNQILCEKYSISLKKWREMPVLPEERFQGNVILNEKNSHLYLFGGSTNGKSNDSILILNLRSVGGWDKIFIKENSELLKRSKCISFSFDENEEDNKIYILGGKKNEREKCDFIIEFNYDNNTINKKDIDLADLPCFDINTVADINKNKFAFTDSKENIYIVEKKNFRITVISSEDV